MLKSRKVRRWENLERAETRNQRQQNITEHEDAEEMTENISGRAEKLHTESSATFNIKTISTSAGSEGSEG